MPAEGKGLRFMVIASAILHGVVAVVVVWGPLWFPARAPIHLPAYQVQLVSLPAEPRKEEPAVKPEPSPPPPPTRKLVAKPKRTTGVVKPSPIKGSRPAAVPTPPPAASKPDQEPPRTEPNRPQNQVASVPRPSEPGVSLETRLMEAVALKFPFYMETLKRKINANWSPPGSVEIAVREVLIAFTIMHDGNISGPMIEQSSGDQFYDQAALRAVYRSSPFPPFPPDFPDETFKVYFSFRLDPNRVD